MRKLYQIYSNTYWGPAVTTLFFFMLAVVTFEMSGSIAQFFILLHALSLLTWFAVVIHQFVNKKKIFGIINLMLLVLLGGITLNMVIHAV